MSDDQQEYVQYNQLRISPEFINLLALLSARDLNFAVHRLIEGAPAGLYVEIYNCAGAYQLSVGDYRCGIEWNFFNGEWFAESLSEPFVTLDVCLSAMDKILLWEAANPEAGCIYPGLTWTELSPANNE
jgi:hypothetical protein